MNMYTNRCFTVKFLLLFIPGIFSYMVQKNLKKDANMNPEPDMLRDVPGLISSKGYPVEVHTVQTVDGYLLTMHRIPYGRNDLKNSSRPVILMQHGLLASSAEFILNYPEQSLGFILADEGYDVWLGNTRGNTYSRRHIKLDPSKTEFWDYSFDQMAQYDLPETIDYILNATENKQIIYIGHSQGTTSAFALLSGNPIYNKKIEIFIALAPVASVGYMTNPLTYLAPFATDIEFLFQIFGVKDLLPNSPIIKFIDEQVCDSKGIFICEDLLSFLFGNIKNINMTRAPVYLAHFPAGSSTKSLIHYVQLFKSKNFQKFDYGKYNMEHYNQDTPPEYDVSKITTPIALYWSMSDNLADIVDVGLLQRKLKSLVESYFVPDANFTHIDFAIAVNARKVLYEQILRFLRQYRK